MCPVPLSKELMNNRKPCHMQPDVYKKIIDQISDMPRFISLYQMGEPLLNKHIFDYIKLAKSKGHEISLTSNGTLLNEMKSNNLIDSKLDKITFSIDGFRPETYEKIRLGAKHEKVCKNIEYLYALKMEKMSRMVIQIDCIDSDLTHKEIPDMMKFWKSRCDIFNIIPLDDWAEQLQLPDNMGQKKWDEKIKKTKRYPCDLLWNTLAISAEGNVMYCCHDFKLTSTLPNVLDMPLKNIWGEIIAIERKKHVNNTIDSTPCLYCNAWKSRSEKTNLSKMIKRFIPLYYQTKLKKLFTFF
jgi:MoaA/NifB/PqqE/SkfB family radical SAM enzyme